MTAFKVVKIDAGFYRVDRVKQQNGRTVFVPAATIERNNFGRKLWQAQIEGRGRVLDAAGFDCFTFSAARKLVLSELNSSQEV